MPSSRPDDQSRSIRSQLILLPLRTHVLDRAADGVTQIVLTFDVVAPRWRIRIFEVGHENIRTRVQRVDDHLAVDGARNLYPPVEQIFGNRGDFPIGLADFGSLWQEIRQLPVVDSLLNRLPAG